MFFPTTKKILTSKTNLNRAVYFFICHFVAGKMVQGAGYLADKATRQSSELAEAMLVQSGSVSGTTTTTTAPTTTMSVAEYNLRQEQLEAEKVRVGLLYLIAICMTSMYMFTVIRLRE